MSTTTDALQLVFVDESGVVTPDSSQPLYAVGAWFFPDCLELHHRLMHLRAKLLAIKGLEGKREFRFADTTYSTVDLAGAALIAGLQTPSHLELGIWSRTPLDHMLSVHDRYRLIISRIAETIAAGAAACSGTKVVVVLDHHAPPRRFGNSLDGLRSLPQVENLLMLDSQATPLIQLVDLAVGVVRHHTFSRADQSANAKRRLVRTFQHCLGVQDLSSGSYQVSQGATVCIRKR